MTLFIGVDPSGEITGNTGIVAIDDDDRIVYVQTVKATDHRSNIHDYFYEVQNRLENLVANQPSVLIAVEDYIVDVNNPANRNKSILTLRLIGWLEGWAYQKKIHLTLQPNRLIKVGMKMGEYEGKYGIRRLKEMGFITEKNGQMMLGSSKQLRSIQHERDALRHAIVLKREWEKKENKKWNIQYLNSTT